MYRPDLRWWWKPNYTDLKEYQGAKWQGQGKFGTLAPFPLGTGLEILFEHAPHGIKLGIITIIIITAICMDLNLRLAHPSDISYLYYLLLCNFINFSSNILTKIPHMYSKRTLNESANESISDRDNILKY